ncbi:hypothetical protein V8E54_010897 [Elaphomyces granulatus]
MPWTSTITTIETQGPRPHSDPLKTPRQAGGEKAPCVHNEPVIGIRLPASVREDNHDIPPCTLEPPLLLSEEIYDASIHTLGAMASKLGFLYYKERSYFPETLTYLAHPDNLITLCSMCYDEFDSFMPDLVIIPTNIEYFIEWEENDYVCRTAAANAGRETPQRTVPRAEDYINSGGKYKAYQLRCGKQRGRISCITSTRRLHSGGSSSPICHAYATLLEAYSKSTVSTTANPLEGKEVDKTEGTKQRLIGSGKDANDRKRKTRGGGEDADNDEGDKVCNNRSRRTKASKKHLDSPDSCEGAFPDDKRRKSLRQRENVVLKTQRRPTKKHLVGNLRTYPATHTCLTMDPIGPGGPGCQRTISSRFLLLFLVLREIIIPSLRLGLIAAKVMLVVLRFSDEWASENQLNGKRRLLSLAVVTQIIDSWPTIRTQTYW